MFAILSFFWIIRETKLVLFYIYLWQLKEYHIGRFLAHFQTAKGKKLLFNKIVFLKLVLLFVFLFLGISYLIGPKTVYAQALVILLLILYFLETVLVINNIFQKKLKTPVLTKKIIFLLGCGLALDFLFILVLVLVIKNIFWFSFGILAFDILSPVIISGLVLFFQPLTVLIRCQIIKKATKKRQKSKELLVIGITGSYGKTSTKEFLATILSEKFKVLKTKEHQNSEMGISQCILNGLKEEHQIFVCEMGAYNKGGIKLLSDITKPKFGILTGINQQHLATFRSLENIIKTKYELIESLSNDGLAVFNGNNKYCLELYKKTKIPKKLCNINKAIENTLQSDIWAEDIQVDKELLYFKAMTKDGDSAQFKVNLLGEKNIENILMAVIVAKQLGMSLQEIASACRKISAEQGTAQIKKSKQRLNIIDSTYSANSDGVMADLEHLKNWDGRRMIVMPSLIELGKAAKEIHRKIGQKIGQICDLAIITTKDYFEEIKKGAVATKIAKENILFMENPEEIFEKIKEFIDPEDVILLESRVPSKLIELLSATQRG